MLKQGFDLKVGQTLSMTPQLQQAIRLLQLSSLELHEEIQQALAENPFLQLAEDNEPDTGDTALPNATGMEQGIDVGTDMAMEDGYTNAEPAAIEAEIPAELAIDANWDDIYDTRNGSQQHGHDDGDLQGFLENQGNSTGLEEHLLWQVRMSNLSDIDKQVATAIICSLDEAGYLREPLEDIHAALADTLPIELEDVAVVLKYIQQLDPIGVGARDLRECLLLQLAHQPESRLLYKARQLVDKHLKLIEKRDYRELCRRLKIEQPELEEIILLLRSLNPRPGSLYTATRTDYIVPDAFVYKTKSGWKVSLNPELTPHLQVNQTYAELASQVRTPQDNQYFKANLQQARWLIRSVESRHSTLLSVAKAIVARQGAFMQYGEQAMRPMTLRDIAEELQMHESTISRVTTNKYLHTPRGIYEFKFFFSSQVETETGAGCSSTAIRALLKKIIHEENQHAPLSDNQLTHLLKQQGIHVARRTVAKYREALAIPPSHERKALVPS